MKTTQNQTQHQAQSQAFMPSQIPLEALREYCRDEESFLGVKALFEELSASLRVLYTQQAVQSAGRSGGQSALSPVTDSIARAAMQGVMIVQPLYQQDGTFADAELIFADSSALALLKKGHEQHYPEHIQFNISESNSASSLLQSFRWLGGNVREGVRTAVEQSKYTDIETAYDCGEIVSWYKLGCLPNGGLVYIVLQDLTTFKMLEMRMMEQAAAFDIDTHVELLEEHNKQLAASQARHDEQREHAAAAVHDLRGMLSAVYGIAELLVQYGDTLAATERTSMLDTILNSSKQMVQAVEGLLHAAPDGGTGENTHNSTGN
jgi:hypothetical protein